MATKPTNKPAAKLPSGPINQHKALAMGKKVNQPLPKRGPQTPA